MKAKLVELLFRGIMAELPEEDRKAIEAAKAKIQAIIDEDPLAGAAALSLIGAELAAKQGL